MMESLYQYEFEYYCEEHVIIRQSTIANTPQQNVVDERHNISLQQMERAMLDARNILNTFWVEVVHTLVHILKKAHFRPNNDKTPYERWHGKPTKINHFKVFGSKCYIKNNDDNLGKFDARDDEGIFLGYSTKSKGYKCYNKILWKIVSNIDVEGMRIYL